MSLIKFLCFSPERGETIKDAIEIDSTRSWIAAEEFAEIKWQKTGPFEDIEVMVVAKGSDENTDGRLFDVEVYPVPSFSACERKKQKLSTDLLQNENRVEE